MSAGIEFEGVSADEAIERLLQSTVEGALLRERRTGDVTVLVTTEERIRALNDSFRHKDAVTDVLTFPAWEGEALTAPPDGYLGDIAICLARAREQAEAYGHSLMRELAFLAVHGTLHLLGYDHMEAGEEREMFARQDEILTEMGIVR